jgi:hypothetical protein
VNQAEKDLELDIKLARQLTKGNRSLFGSTEDRGDWKAGVKIRKVQVAYNKGEVTRGELVRLIRVESENRHLVTGDYYYDKWRESSE